MRRADEARPLIVPSALQEMFEDFNARFFSSQITGWRLRSFRWPIGRYRGDHVKGRVEWETREIRVWTGERSEEEVAATLLHEPCR